MFIDDQTKAGKLPRAFKKVIPAAVKEAARQEYEKWDKPAMYADVQREMARALLKLRVTFEENAVASTDAGYFVNFRLTDKANEGVTILLQGPENSNHTTGQWLGCASVKAHHLQNQKNGKNVNTVKVDEWRAASREGRFAMLFEITSNGQQEKKRMSA